MDELHKPFFEFALNQQGHWFIYHHHKEQMAYTASVVYMTASISLAISGGATIQGVPIGVSLTCYAFLAFCAFMFVGWQFWNRSIAQDKVNGNHDLLITLLSGKIEEPEKEVATEVKKVSKAKVIWGKRTSTWLTFGAMGAITILCGWSLIATAFATAKQASN